MIQKIDHINLSVANLERSLEWYWKVFGFEKKESGLSPRGRPFAIIESQGFMLCLYEEPQRKRASDFNQTEFHQLNHFGLRISDPIEWRKTLKKNSIAVGYGGEIQYPRSTSWYIQDPSGHEIEVSYSEHGLWC